MNLSRINRRFAAGLVAALLLLITGFSFAVAAQQAMPIMAILTPPGRAMCAPIKAERGAVVRGGSFAIEVQGLQSAEEVFISLVFPDGRVYSPTVAQIDGPGGLDGIADTPADAGFTGVANSGGDYFAFFETTDKWPRGCYQITALGGQSQNVVTGHVVVQDPPAAVINAGQLALTAQNRATRQNSGPQGVTIDIFGRGFLSEETVELRMVQPDGTVIILDPPPVSLVGSFQVDLVLDTDRQAGDYRFIATSGSGHTVGAAFTLVRGPIAARGFGRVRIADPFPPVVAQGDPLQLQGKNFGANEAVTCRLIQPNGAVSTVATFPANELGEFTVAIPTDQQLRTGAHTLVLESATTVTTTTFTLTQGPVVVPADALAGPNAWLPTSAPPAGGSPTAAPPTVAPPTTMPTITPGKGDPLTATPVVPTTAPTDLPTAVPTMAPTETAAPVITPGKGDPLPTAAPSGDQPSVDVAALPPPAAPPPAGAAAPPPAPPAAAPAPPPAPPATPVF